MIEMLHGELCLSIIDRIKLNDLIELLLRPHFFNLSTTNDLVKCFILSIAFPDVVILLKQIKLL